MPLLTILAEGTRYALLGDTTGQIIPMPRRELERLSGEYARPVLLAAPPLDAPRIGTHTAVIRLDLPPDCRLYLQYYTEPISRITIYYVFYEGRYYLRELRNDAGRGSGKYHREG
jgi:hypothetical protein